MKKKTYIKIANEVIDHEKSKFRITEAFTKLIPKDPKYKSHNIQIPIQIPREKK